MENTLILEAIKNVLTSVKEITKHEEDAIVGALRAHTKFENSDIDTMLRMISH